MMMRQAILAILCAASWTGSVAAQRSCNGSPSLCGRSIANTTFVGSHNSPFVGILPSHNQYVSVTDQMKLGVRFLQAQTQDKRGAVQMCHTACELLDVGPLADYLKPIKAFLDGNPNEVITMLLTNPDALSVTLFADAFRSTGLEAYAFVPGKKLALAEWPTLGSLIDSGKRLIVFMDYHSDTGKVPYILDEFQYYFETPFSRTDAKFPDCNIDRPSGAKADGRMYIANHALNFVLDIFGNKIIIPDQVQASNTNSLASINAEVNLCTSKHGRPPNVVLLDWINIGNAMGAQADANKLRGASRIKRFMLRLFGN